MTSINLSANNLVEIVFDDPTEFDTTRNNHDEPVECRTIGWVERANESSIRISWLKEIEDSPYVGLTIPIGCIKKITTIDSKNQVEYRRDNVNGVMI